MEGNTVRKTHPFAQEIFDKLVDSFNSTERVNVVVDLYHLILNDEKNEKIRCSDKTLINDNNLSTLANIVKS